MPQSLKKALVVAKDPIPRVSKTLVTNPTARSRQAGRLRRMWPATAAPQTTRNQTPAAARAAKRRVFMRSGNYIAGCGNRLPAWRGGYGVLRTEFPRQNDPGQRCSWNICAVSLPYGGAFAGLWIWLRRRRREGWGEAKLCYEEVPAVATDLGIKDLTYAGTQA